MSYLLYLMFRCDRRCDGCDGKFGNFVGTKHTHRAIERQISAQFSERRAQKATNQALIQIISSGYIYFSFRFQFV